MATVIQLTRGDAGMNMVTDHIEYLRCQPSCDMHLFEFFCGFEGYSHLFGIQ
jgi:hypothetical protein